MKTFFNILLLLLVQISFACQTSGVKETIIVKKEKSIYVSPDGQIELERINDSIWHTTFMNNDGFVFDTTMIQEKNNKTIFFNQPNQLFFLKFHWGGLSVTDSKIVVFELASYGMLGDLAKMWGVYQNSFYKIGEDIVLDGNISNSKAGLAIDDVFLKGVEKPSEDYIRVTGRITKEPYPRSFYSTAESPQGMFGDTTKIYYRIVMENPKFELLEKTIYKGYPLNTSENKAAIAWEFADSEASILEGHALWTAEELQQKISVQGVLIQNNIGSVLKNWKIITN